MKYVKYLILAFVLAPLFFVNSGCNDKEVTPTKKDTTATIKDTAHAGFTVSFDKYELVLDANQSDAHYRSGDDRTIVFVVGNSTKVSGTAIVDGKGEAEIQFPGNTTGSWSQSNKDDITIEAATGVAPKRSEYSYDNTSNMVVTCTAYPAVGGRIKGTFSGTLKSGINSYPIKNGWFEIERSADQ
ncbi:MAG: hypothetical protein GC181_05825 [Bacteroidetes bacterium]|nr:hypothetical protein [Bacteroidota bacterium]